jgi:16S rRNA G966 N2-methylase RsmD
MSKFDYHSALKTINQQSWPMVKRYSNQYIEAFAFDFEEAQEMPTEFKKADFIYCEPPWQRGYNEFNKRVSKTSGKGWGTLISKLGEYGKSTGKPCVILGDKVFRKYLQGYDEYPLYFVIHRCPVIAYVVNFNDMAGVNDNHALQDRLYERYDIGLDMFCGYGILGRHALKHKKRAILTDFNEQCIGYIANNLTDANILK